MDHLCYLCIVFSCFYSFLFVDALWSTAGKVLAMALVCDV